jgi:uncharacterized protein involved in exopolysaccharide biosynthesis
MSSENALDSRFNARASDADPDEAAPGLSTDQLLDSLRRTRSWIVLLTLLGFAGGCFFAIVTPNSYMSVGKVMVRWGSREQTTSDAVDGPQRGAATSRTEDIQTEIQMLTAPIVFERTVRALGAGSILSAGDPSGEDDATTPAPIHWFHVAQRWWFDQGVADITAAGCCPDHSCPRCIDAAIRTLETRVIIQQSPGTSVIDVAGIAASPEEAKKLVDALLVQINERHREFFATDSAYDFLSKQMNDAKQSRDDAAFRLADSRQTCHVYDLPAQRTALLKEKEDLEVLSRSHDIELKSIGSQLAQYARWLAAAKEKKPETVKVPAPNPAYDRCLKGIEELRTKRDGLLATRLPDSPDVVNLDHQIAAATDTLNSTPPTIMVESTTDAAQQILRIQGEVETLLARKSGLEAASEAVAAHRLQLEDELEKLSQCEPDLKSKEKELETRTADAARYTEAFDRYAVTKALDAAKMSNLRQVQAATMPFEKSGPNRKLFIALGVLLGGGLGLVLAFLRAAFDRKVRSAAEIEKRLGVRVICTMPEVGLLRRAAP